LTGPVNGALGGWAGIVAEAIGAAHFEIANKNLNVLIDKRKTGYCIATILVVTAQHFC
jgi:hypothetical protein